MSDIFISYASENREQAHKLASALETLDWSVWWDRHIITGQAYDQVIERELNNAKSVVVLWSGHSVASEWVKNEAAAAAERGVLLPVLIERVTVPLEFRRKQTADLIGWDGDPAHSGFQALCRGVSATIGGVGLNRLTMVQRSGSRWNRRWTLAAVATILLALLAVYSAVRWRSQAEPARVDIHAQVGTNASTAHIEVNRSIAQSEPSRTSANLLSAENGGRLLLAPSDAWTVTVDGKEEQYREVEVGEEAVFGFKDERRATFDTFGMLIPKSGRNPKEFELLAGDDSPSGPFRAIGTFHPQDAKLFQTGGWQDFKFPPVTAKYLKVKLRSNYADVVWIDLYEFRLLGQLKEAVAAPAATLPPANSAAVEPADLVAGKYFGEVIADSKGSSRSDVVLTITKLDKWSVRITSDYPRLGTVDVTLTRAGGKIVNAGGNAVFLMDPNARPLKLEYNPNGELVYAGRKQ